MWREVNKAVQKQEAAVHLEDIFEPMGWIGESLLRGLVKGRHID